MEKTCLHCGGIFIAPKKAEHSKKYCSKKCANRGHRSLDEYKTRERERSRFRRDYIMAHRKAKGYRQKYKPKPKMLWIVHCSICGSTCFRQHRSKAWACSPRCKSARSCIYAKRKSESAYTPKVFFCKECGGEHTTAYGRTRREFCSDRCLKRFAKRLRKIKQKMKTPDTASIEPFGPWEIYKRDEYKCQLCGEKVDLAAHYLDPYAPTIDHIIPIANGGAHRRENVQTAHRICNSVKSDRPVPSMFFAINDMPGAIEKLTSLTRENGPQVRCNIPRNCNFVRH